jgi:serine protease Do
MKLTLKVIVIGFIAGFCGAYVLYYFGIKPALQKVEGEAQLQPVHYSGDERFAPPLSSPSSSPTPILAGVDFSDAAAKATQSVVFINSISQGASVTYWDWFFRRWNRGRANPSQQRFRGYIFHRRLYHHQQSRY